MAPGEAAQERPQRGRRRHRVAEHRLGGPGPQRIGVVDGVAPREGGVDEGHGLVAYVGVAERITEVDMFFEQFGQAEMPGQGGR